VTALAKLPGVPLVVGDARGRVRALDANGALLWQLSGVDRGVRALAVDPEEWSGRLLVVASRNRALQGWEFSEEFVGVRVGDAMAFGWLESEPSARAAVLVGERNGRVRNAAGRTYFEGPGGRIRAVAGAKGRVLAGGDDGVVRVMEDPPRELVKGDGAVLALAVAPDGEHAAFSFADGTLKLYRLDFGREVESVRGSPAEVLTFSADGRWLAAGRADKRLVVIDTVTAKETGQFELDGVPGALAFSADGQKIAVGLDGAVALWDFAAQREVSRMNGGTERVRSLSFSTEGRRLAAGSDDGQGYVWSLAGRRLTHVLPLDAGDVKLVRFVDEDHLVAAGSDRVLRAVSLTP
jgi:WD40 repeat protein